MPKLVVVIMCIIFNGAAGIRANEKGILENAVNPVLDLASGAGAFVELDPEEELDAKIKQLGESAEKLRQWVKDTFDKVFDNLKLKEGKTDYAKNDIKAVITPAYKKVLGLKWNSDPTSGMEWETFFGTMGIETDKAEGTETERKAVTKEDLKKFLKHFMEENLVKRLLDLAFNAGAAVEEAEKGTPEEELYAKIKDLGESAEKLRQWVKDTFDEVFEKLKLKEGKKDYSKDDIWAAVSPNTKSPDHKKGIAYKKVLGLKWNENGGGMDRSEFFATMGIGTGKAEGATERKAVTEKDLKTLLKNMMEKHLVGTLTRLASEAAAE